MKMPALRKHDFALRLTLIIFIGFLQYSLEGGIVRVSKWQTDDLRSASVKLQQPENEDAIRVKSQVSLNCLWNGGIGDNIQYRWYRNGERLKNTPKYNMRRETVLINMVTSMDNGVYSCSIHVDGRIVESMQNFILKLKEDGVPIITVLPSDLFLPPGSTAVFTCTYADADSMEWFKDDIDIPLENSSRITIHKDGLLEIADVTMRDAGVYSCVAYQNHVADGLQTFSARLRVAALHPLNLSSFTPVLPAHRAIWSREGSSLQIHCRGSLEDRPPAVITWTGPGGNLLPRDFIESSGGADLIIDKVQMSDGGVYTCISENMADSHEFSFYLIVYPTPNFLIHPKLITVEENAATQLECKYELREENNSRSELFSYWKKLLGHDANQTILDSWMMIFQKEEVFWKKDDDRVVKEEYGRLTMSQSRPLVRVERTSVGDRGVYWCEVNSSQPSLIYRSERATLHAKEKLRFSPPPINKKLELNSTGKIHCKVQGSPTPNITWFRDDGEQLPEQTESINGTLMFRVVHRAHAGNYTCHAQNEEDSIQHTITVDVVVSPRFISPLGSPVLEVTEGSAVWIDCVAVGDPEPRTQWDRNSNIIATRESDDDSYSNSTNDGDAINRGSGIGGNGRIILLNNGTLHIRSVRTEDGDRYGCTAGNSAGLKREEVSLVVHPTGGTQGSDLGGQPYVYGWDGYPTNFMSMYSASGPEDSGMIGKAVVITVGVAAAYMLLVVGLMLYCRHRRRRKLHQASEKIELNEVECRDKDGQSDKLMENCEEGDGENGTIAPENNSGLGKNKCNGTGSVRPKNGHLKNPRSGEDSSTNARSDNSELSINSRTSKRSAGNQGTMYDKLSMPRNLMINFITLGRGEFGEIILAKLDINKLRTHRANMDKESIQTDEHLSISVGEEQQASGKLKPVMIKSLTQTRDEAQLAEFKRQLDSFSKLRHENVARIIGLCNEIEPHYLVFEYTDWGDFKQFLLATRTADEVAEYRERIAGRGGAISDATSESTSDPHGATPLVPTQRLVLASHLAAGMLALSDARMVHRDLATRNCIINSRLGLKISIPAVTKGQYSQEYCKHQNQVIPLRWLPHECIYEGDYSSKSDVYMFAATVWEIFYKAELPFAKMNDNTVLTHLKNNTLTWKPHEEMPIQLSQILEQCWSVSPKDRPTFNDISKSLNDILAHAAENV